MDFGVPSLGDLAFNDVADLRREVGHLRTLVGELRVDLDLVTDALRYYGDRFLREAECARCSMS